MAAVDFGTDDNKWANDGECDDPRFEGQGMTSTALLTEDIGRDATDCREAMEKGDLRLAAAFEEPASPAAIAYGDDASEFANNGLCEDVRFADRRRQPGLTIVDTIAGDATDCRAAVEAGDAEWQGAVANPI